MKFSNGKIFRQPKIGGLAVASFLVITHWNSYYQMSPEIRCLAFTALGSLQGGHSSGKPGKVRELKNGQGKMNYYNSSVAVSIVQTEVCMLHNWSQEMNSVFVLTEDMTLLMCVIYN